MGDTVARAGDALPRYNYRSDTALSDARPSGIRMRFNSGRADRRRKDTLRRSTNDGRYGGAGIEAVVATRLAIPLRIVDHDPVGRIPLRPSVAGAL